jgi:CheY-like chemotaxis protein
VFRLVLPVIDAPAPEGVGGPATAPVERLRVLIIDDERSLGDALRLLLTSSHDVQTTTSARDAIVRIESGARFDVILCDVMMPDMDGIAFYARLQEIAPSLAPRVGFLTGGAFTGASREFLKRIPNPCLEKPFELGEVLHLIGTLAEASPS